MALSVKKGTFAIPTGTGNHSISAVGFEPKLVLFFITPASADGFTDGGRIGFGAAVSSSQRKAIAIATDDNTADSNTGRRQADRALTLLANGTPTVHAEADLVSMDADGFTLNFNPGGGLSQPICHYLALGGSDLISVKVGEFTLPTSADSAYEVTGVGFQPDAILLFGVRDDAALPANSSQASMFLGAASSTTARACCSYANQDAQATTVLARFLTASKVIHELTNAGALRAEADLVSFDTDGFTLNVSTAPAVADRVFYVALKGARFKIGVETQKTSTGTKATTGIGFAPTALVFFGINRINGASIDTTSAQMGVSIGAGVSGSESCAWAGGADAAGTTDENANQGETKVLRHASSPSTVNAEADISSLDSDGYTLDWTTADGTAREFIHFAIGPAAGTAHSISLAGSLTPAGALSRLTGKGLSGAFTPAGNLTRAAAKLLAGGLSPAGSLTRTSTKELAGTITPAGALQRTSAKALAGSVSPSGGLSRATSKALAGALTPAGVLSRQVAKVLSGGLSFLGTLATIGGTVAEAITRFFDPPSPTGRISGTPGLEELDPPSAHGRLTSKPSASEFDPPNPKLL